MKNDRSSALPARACVAAALATLLAAGACRDGTGSGDTPGIAVVSGANARDTAAAYLEKPLVVEVRGPGGRPAQGVVVRFGGSPPPGVFTSSAAYVAPFGTALWGPSADVTTDSRGRASVHVRLGMTAGTARIDVSAQGMQTAAEYEVLPGAPVRVAAAPRDSAVYVGGQYTLRAGLADRYGNLRGEPVELVTSSSAITLSAGVVRGAAIGRAKITVRSGGWVDSAFVSVVPQGTFSFREFGRFVGDSAGLAMANLDGSGYRRLVAQGSTPTEYSPHGEGTPRWFPAEGRFVFEAAEGGTRRLFVSDLSRNVRRLIPSPPPTGAETDPAVSPDGGWVYFAGDRALWRVRADGTGAERLPGSDAGEFRWLSVSPDGTRLAYVARGAVWQSFQLHVRDIATGAATRIGAAEAAWPRWSPDGQWIAYVNSLPYPGYSGRLRVVRPDGTGDREVVAANYYPGVDWSPDGRYLIATQATNLGAEVIDFATGERLRLGFASGWYGPQWRR